MTNSSGDNRREKLEKIHLEITLGFVYISLYVQYVFLQEDAMPLSIRNPRAEQLARAVAAHSGENLTQAIIHALEERLERLKGRHTSVDLVQAILKISRRCQELPEKDSRSTEEILSYDDRGIPR